MQCARVGAQVLLLTYFDGGTTYSCLLLSFVLDLVLLCYGIDDLRAHVVAAASSLILYSVAVSRDVYHPRATHGMYVVLVLTAVHFMTLAKFAYASAHAPTYVASVMNEVFQDAPRECTIAARCLMVYAGASAVLTSYADLRGLMWISATMSSVFAFIAAMCGSFLLVAAAWLIVPVVELGVYSHASAAEKECMYAMFTATAVSCAYVIYLWPLGFHDWLDRRPPYRQQRQSMVDSPESPRQARNDESVYLLCACHGDASVRPECNCRRYESEQLYRPAQPSPLPASDDSGASATLPV